MYVQCDSQPNYESAFWESLQLFYVPQEKMKSKKWTGCESNDLYRLSTSSHFTSLFIISFKSLDAPIHFLYYSLSLSLGWK